MPVRLPGNDILIFPALPLIFAICGLYGPGAATLSVAVAMGVLGLIMALRAKNRRPRSLAQFVAAPILTDGLPALLYCFLHALLFPHNGLGRGETPGVAAWIVLALCTMFAFGASYLLSTFLSSRFSGRRWDVIWHDNARWNMLSGVLMSPVAFVAGVLYREHWWLGVLFILVPTWALHSVVVHHQRTVSAYKMGVELLGRIMQESHPYTHGHLNRVAHWAKKIAEELSLPPESMQFMEDAAILHDIGKVAVDDRVLNKVGKLTDDDWTMIRRHPVVGAEIVGQIRYFNKVSHWIMHHHERPDGAGYPDRLGSDDIPIEAGIISVVDAYDAMVGGPAKEDKRPYRDPMAPEAAVAELWRHAGTQFNARVVEAFIGILAREKALEESGEHPLRLLEPEGDSLWETPLTTAGNGTVVPMGGRP